MWSFFLVIVMAVLGVLPAIPAVVPALAIGTRAGTAMYVVSVLLVGGAALYAQWREVKAQQLAQVDRDIVIKRLSEDVTTLVGMVRELQKQLPPGSPEHKTFEKAVGEILLHLPTIRGTAVTTPSFTPSA